MSSLSTCIKKAGKALSANDAASIREIATDLGDPKAAIDEYLGTLAEERAELTERIKAAGGNVAEVGASSSRFAPAWHGSRHKFMQFLNEFIGTGEGNQAFGWGLYFAQAMGVAKGYQRKLSKTDFSGLKNLNKEEVAFVLDAHHMRTTTPDIWQTLVESTKDKDNWTANLVRKIESGEIAPNNGHLYEVNIPDEIIAEMLDWDAPLSKQTKNVQKLVAELGLDEKSSYAYAQARIEEEEEKIAFWKQERKEHIAGRKIFTGESGKRLKRRMDRRIAIAEEQIETLKTIRGNELTGAQIYTEIVFQQGELDAQADAQKAASILLNEAGIPGNKFLDQQSRNNPVKTGGGFIKPLLDALRSIGATRNFVLFDPSVITSIKRDGELVHSTDALRSSAGNKELLGPRSRKAYDSWQSALAKLDERFSAGYGGESISSNAGPQQGAATRASNKFSKTLADEMGVQPGTQEHINLLTKLERQTAIEPSSPVAARTGQTLGKFSYDNPSAEHQKFIALADAQRGLPESAMLKAQSELGGGILNVTIEHVGDITHRMSERNALAGNDMGLEYVQPKVKRALNALESKYGFAREHNENLASNARFRGISLEEQTKSVNEALRKYANEHRKLPVFNKMQQHAQRAAIALGEQRWQDAINNLKVLDKVLDAGPEAWKAEASKMSMEEETDALRSSAEGDLFGDNTDAQQRIADEIAKRDKKRNTGQDEVETGKVDDLFSEASKQNDLRFSINKTDREFKVWFGDSKVVDENGDPLVVYHGTADDIVSFDLNHPNRKDTGWLGTGIYLSDDAALASAYSNIKAGSENPNVMPLYAAIKNPYYATLEEKQKIQLVSHRDAAEGRKLADQWTQELISRGHDGVILQYKAKDVGKSNASREIVAFSPSQVKSATGNSGAYDAGNPDIRFSINNDFDEALVDAHPENPLAQINKIGALNATVHKTIDTESKVNRLIKDVKEVGVFTALGGTKFVKSLMYLSPQTKLGDYIRDGMRSIPQYTHIMDLMDSFISTALEDITVTANEWRDFINKNEKQATRMGVLLFESSRAETDPSKDFVMPKNFDKMTPLNKREWILRKRNHSILRTEWDKLGEGKQTTYQERTFNTNKEGETEEVVITESEPRSVSEGQKIFLKVRDDFALKYLQKQTTVSNAIRTIVKDERKQAAAIAMMKAHFEKGRLKMYFPFKRFGKYWGTVKDPNTGEIIAFEKFEDRRERNAWVSEWVNKGYSAFRSEEKDSLRGDTKSIDPKFVRQVEDLIGGIKDPEGNTLPGVKQVQDQIYQMYLKSLPAVSASKSQIHRKGTIGYTMDAIRAYGDEMFHGVHQIGKLKYGPDLNSALDSVDIEAQDLMERPTKIERNIKKLGLQGAHDIEINHIDYAKIFNRLTSGTVEERIQKTMDRYLMLAKRDSPWVMPLRDEMHQRHAFNMNPISSVWSTNMTSFGFAWFLSSSPAAGLLNLTQTAIVGFPTLLARYNTQGAGSELLKASYELARTKGSFKNKLNGDEQAAFTQFATDGTHTKTRTRDMMGYAEHGSEFTGKKQRMLEIAGYIFHITEKWNREITSLAAYRLDRKETAAAVADGTMSNEEAHERAIFEAKRLTEKSHFNYGNTNRPRIMQSDQMRVMLLFRNYSLNMQYRLLRDFRDGIWKNEFIDKEVRVEARKSLVGILGMTSLFAGLSGMPMAWAFYAIADNLFGDDDEPLNSKTELRAHIRDQYGEQVATAIMTGPWDAFTGTTLSNRAGLNNLWLRELPENRSSLEMFKHILFEITGPIGGIGANVMMAKDLAKEEQYVRAVEKIVPKFVADAMKAVRYNHEGALNYDGIPVMKPEDFTKPILIAQFFGLVPSHLTTIYEQQRATKDYVTALGGRKKILYDDLYKYGQRLYQAEMMGDKREAKAARIKVDAINTELATFAQKHPDMAFMGVSAQGIMQSARSRRKAEFLAVDGLSLSVKEQAAHKKFQLVDRDEEKDGDE